MGVPVSRRQRVYQRQVARAAVQPQESQLIPVMAPIGGLNFKDSIIAMPISDAINAANVIMRTDGVMLRPGWKQQVTNILDPGTSAETDVKTMMPYIATSGPLDNKLFAAVHETVFDVTDPTSIPVIGFTDVDATGIWSHTMHSNTDDNMFLCTVNNGAGYYTYDSTGGWIHRVLTAGPANIDNITSVTSAKNRLWFTFENNNSVWYLALGAISGALVEFPVGPLLTKGGVLQCCGNWTKDSADQGVSDLFLIFGAQGNIIVYQGADPSSAATWDLVGNWDLGRFPAGTQFFTKKGADLVILSSRGITPLSAVISGTYNLETGGPISLKINNALVPAVNSDIESFGWELRVLPKIDSLMVLQPQNSSGINTQWLMSLTTAAWSTFDGIEMTCSTLFNETFYFGRSDGVVGVGMEFGYDTDGETLSGTDGSAIEADVQPAFNPFGSPGLLKIFQAARLIFIAPAAPSVSIRMNTQFNIQAAPGSPSFTTPSGSRWDVALWDSGVWAGADATFEVWAGITGVGYYGSLRMNLRGLPGTAWSAAHILFTPGSPQALM